METSQKIDALSRVPVFAVLSETELAQLAQSTIYRRENRFRFVFVPDENNDYVYLLLKGRIKIGTFSQEGKEVIKEILQPEQLFGDLALAGESTHTEFAQTLHDDVTYLQIRMSDIQQLLQHNQRFVYACITHLSNRLQRVEDRLAKLVLKDARERIIEFIVETAGKEGRRVGFETLVKHYLTQQDIANITGTSRQTVTSVLNDLRKANLIHFNRSSILIRDMEKLA